MPTGRIFEIKRFAVHDGPGIRTTVFFKGCPLSCLWCHNPEGIAFARELAFLERKCACCGVCFTACPLGLHAPRDGVHSINRERCTLCGECVSACIPEALKIYGREYAVGELLALALADADFYKRSGGGVTCSGGEPLAQPDFLAGFLSACKGAGLHAAVDTSGHAPWASFEKILPFTDIFLYDVKHMDAAEHKRLTGVDNRLILDNLGKLGASGVPIEVRMPIIPGLNDSDESIRAAAKFLMGIASLTRVCPLPYHALSGSKYASLGKPSPMPAATGEENAAVRRAAEILGGEGLKVSLPG